jgi:DNA-directed RNA polymerase specialized sigma24 family protein
VLKGDPEAPSALAQWLFDRLIHRLAKAYGNLDPHIIASAVHDAILAYLKKPQCFDPGQGTPLDTFLKTVARNKLLNALNQDGASRERETKWAEHLWQGRDVPAFSEPVVWPNQAPSEAAELAQKFEGLLADPVDRQIFRLWRQGEDRVERYSAVMGIGRLPQAEQRLLVKRAKDRVVQAFRRWAEKRRAKSGLG